VRVNAVEGVLSVRWGAAESETCQFSYRVPERGNKDASFRRVEALCLQGVEAGFEIPADGTLSMRP